MKGGRLNYNNSHTKMLSDLGCMQKKILRTDGVTNEENVLCILNNSSQQHIYDDGWSHNHVSMQTLISIIFTGNPVSNGHWVTQWHLQLTRHRDNDTVTSRQLSSVFVYISHLQTSVCVTSDWTKNTVQFRRISLPHRRYTFAHGQRHHILFWLSVENQTTIKRKYLLTR